MEIELQNHHRRKQKRVINVSESQLTLLLAINEFEYAGENYTISYSKAFFNNEETESSSYIKRLVLIVYTDETSWEC